MNKILKWSLISLTIIIILLLSCGVGLWLYVNDKYEGEDTWVFIPTGSSDNEIKGSLIQSLGNMGSTVYSIWDAVGSNPNIASGAYLIANGTSALDIARKIKSGSQTPIKVTFNNIRLMPELAEKLAEKFEFTAEDFINACDSILPKNGFKKEWYQAAFLPDTYEFYWTATPGKVAQTLLDYRNRFWNDSRREQAQKLGLNPVKVATIASIIEEESAKKDERPKIARLYLNRLNRGMKLQADPTVKFAVGDFTLKRITNTHTNTQSPYNTYLTSGLPPGPIRIAEKSALEAVLNAPSHNYIYMCAKDDFSGYHNFATNYNTHLANARRYHRALNNRGIK